MSIKYTESQTIENVKMVLNDPKILYKQPFTNWRGETWDTKRKYTEVVSEYLLENLEELNKIPVLKRKTSYNQGHNGTTPRDASNRTEERIALSMFGKTYAHIGKILDYQVPLKDVQKDEGIGKIDILSYDGEYLYILELKQLDSQDTLLWCVLQAYTYYKTVDTLKLLQDFDLPTDTIVKQAVFVFAEKFAHLHYKDGHPKTCELMKELGVDIFIIRGDETTGYEVTLP